MFWSRNRCPNIQRLLSGRVDEPLSARAEKRVQAHLSKCPECRETLAFFEELKNTAGDLETMAPPLYLWERISVELDEHPWGDEETAPVQSNISGSRAMTRRINFAGALLSLILVASLSLIPGGVSHESRAVHSSVLGNNGNSDDLEYVSLYLMANQNRFPAEVRHYYLNQMEGLNRKIKTIKSALELYPQNHNIKAQLAYVYRQKIELYEKLGISLGGGSAARDFPGDELMRGGGYE
jgi:hypothetical protein